MKVMEKVDESYKNTSTTDNQLYFSLFDDEFAVFVKQNLSLANATFGINDTYFIYGATYYPSGYSLPAIFIASAFAIILMVFVVVGNLLVIVAIVTEKSLKNIQNWFIASLAVADFFLGVLIIPFSLANELMGYWIFGALWCDIHSAMDVLLCTASIMNLCLISLDRYWSITQAVDYLKKRTPLRAAIMITFVWIMSAVICIPPLLGWKVRRQPEKFPKCEVSLMLSFAIHCVYNNFNPGEL